jgi:dolichyl-phosphate-mannose--protein O-mannosyl transferase
MVGQGTYQSAEQGEFILYTNNLPVWILTIPSLIAMSIVAVRKRAKILGLPALFFCATYVLFLFVKRPAFIYSAAPLLPFAFTAIAYAIVRLTERYGVRMYYAVLIVMVAWNLYLYPLVTAKKVPVALYSYILNKADVKIH